MSPAHWLIVIAFVFVLSISNGASSDSLPAFPTSVLSLQSLLCSSSRMCAVKSQRVQYRSEEYEKELSLLRSTRHPAWNFGSYEEDESCFEPQEGRVMSSQVFMNTKMIARKRLLLMIVATLYGAQYSAQTLLQRELPPSIVSLIRFVCASMIFLPKSIKYLFRMFENLRTNREYYGDSKFVALGPIWGGLEVGLLSTVGYISQSMCLQFSTPSKCSFSMGLNVLFVPFLDFVFKDQKSNSFSKTVGESRSLSRVLPALLAFIGIAFLECGGMEPPQFKDLFLLVTPLTFSAAFFRGEYYARKYPLDTSAMVGSLLGTTALFSLLWSWIDGTLVNFGCLLKQIKNSYILSIGLVFIGFCCTAWATYHEQSGMQVVSAAETTLIYSLEPLTATAFSAILLKEQLTKSTGYGAFCILSACILDALGIRYLKELITKFWTPLRVRYTEC